MKYIGIDVSSRKLNLHITGLKSQDFEIVNSEQALEEFLQEQQLDPADYIVGAESTGRYHLICQKFFVLKGFEFRLLNPIITKQMTKATIRKKKTDKADAKKIALLISQGEGQAVEPEHLEKLKRTFLRTRRTVVQHQSALKLLVQELEREYTDPDLDEAITVLKEIEGSMEEAAEALKQKALAVPKSSEEELIESIPGFGQLLAAVVASEVGDIQRFDTVKQFKAYIGIDSRVTQSGKHIHLGKIRKGGLTHPRWALFMAGKASRRYDPEIRAFYELKIAQGKPYKVAMVAVMRKLCERVFAVVRRGRPYEVREVEVEAADKATSCQSRQ